VKIGSRWRLQGVSRWLAIAGALLVVGLLAVPVSAPEPGGDHPNDMNCGNTFWLTPPEPVHADPGYPDPDYEFYREKMDRGCREARFTRAATATLVTVITLFGVGLRRRRDETFSS
jgi:hypothetical protein